MLLLNDLQDLHGACLDTNATSDALSGGTILGSHHNLHGTDLYTLATGSAELLVDHVDTGLGVLGNRTSLTDLCTLAALDADHRLCLALLLHDLDAGQVLMELLIECGRAGIDTLQASHTLAALLNCKLLHCKESPLLKVRLYYTSNFKKYQCLFSYYSKKTVFGKKQQMAIILRFILRITGHNIGVI